MVGGVLGAALIFEFVNGFHDTGNAIATSLATRALSPRGALFLAGFGNFCGAFLSTRVAETVGKGILREEYVFLPIIFAGLLGALAWNLITWYLALPTSSSHALIGGLAGAAFAAFGLPALNWSGLAKIFCFLLLSPVLGLAGGILFFSCLRFCLPRSGDYARVFRRLQLISAFLVALTHGSNDAQKVMGIITMTLFGIGLLPSFEVPVWVMLISALTLALGTAAGGWRIIATLGTRLTKLFPEHGFAAETAAALVIYAATLSGAPVSTTHVVAAAIIGVGASQGRKNVAWNLAREIGVAWLLTIPLSGLIGAGFYFLLVLGRWV
ncbi:MAG: inorganic phosphate transporter [Bacillota bacterium]|nr:inorganic phosphate transporter [Bacillota bacterium]